MQPSPIPSPLPDIFPSYPAQCWQDQCGKCTAACDNCDNHLAEISQSLLMPLITALEESDRTMAQTMGSVLGSFERAMQTHDELLSKLSGKIQNRLTSLMGEAYGWGVAVGVPVPEMDEVHAVNNGWIHPLASLQAPEQSIPPSNAIPEPMANPIPAVGSENPGDGPEMCGDLHNYYCSTPTETTAPVGTPVPVWGTISTPSTGVSTSVGIPTGTACGSGSVSGLGGTATDGGCGTVSPCSGISTPWTGCGDASQTLGLLACVLRTVLSPPCGDDGASELPIDGIGTRVAGPLPADAYKTRMLQDGKSCGSAPPKGMDIGHWYGWKGQDKDGAPILYVAASPADVPINTSTGEAIFRNKTVEEIAKEGYGFFKTITVYCSGDNKGDVSDLNPPKPVEQPKTPSLTTAQDWQSLWAMMKLPDWGKPDVCETVKQLVALLDSATTGGLSQILGLTDAKGGDKTPEWMGNIVGADSLGVGKMVAALMRFVVGIQDAELKAISSFLPCSMGSVYLPVLIKVLIGALKNWVGGDYHQIEQSLDYLYNSACQTEIPGPSEADEGFLTNQLSEKEWECLVKAGGQFTSWRKKLLQSKRHKLSPEDAYRLWARGLVTELWAKDYLRQDGYINGFEADDAWRLMEEKPGISDIIRFMVRNVGDEELVKRLRMDEEFDQKYNTQMESWALEHGMTKETAKYHWRAHWLEPAPTQLYTMLQRLRPGRVPKEIETDEKLVRVGLGANDWSPFWRDRLVAISYRTMTRVDARRAFNSGTIDAKELGEIYQDQGYSPKTAAQLVDFTSKTRDAGAASNKWVKLYAKGGIKRADAEAGALHDGIGADAIKAALDFVDAAEKAASARVCQKGIKSQFMSGGIDYATAVARLHDTPMDNETVVRVADQWRCELAGRNKVATTAQLCQWYTAGILTMEDYLVRLGRIGWSKDDAERIAGTCSARSDLKAGAKLYGAARDLQMTPADPLGLGRPGKTRPGTAPQPAPMAPGVPQDATDGQG